MSEMAKKEPLAFLREARLRAGYVSRGTASIRVPFSPETIGRHERGEAEVEPEDALIYAQCYKAPDLLPRYCAICPVGKAMGKTATILPLPFATLRISHLIDEAQDVADCLERIAFDGKITLDEVKDFEAAVKFLRELAESIESMCLIARTAASDCTSRSGCSGK